MTIASSLFAIMYTFSASLLYPVVILLIMSVMVSLILIGEFISEYSKRHRDLKNLEQTCIEVQQHIDNSDYDSAANSLGALKQNRMVSGFAKDSADHLKNRRLTAIERLSGDYEIKMAKHLEQTRIMATVAPMLGLMGTLIPMGPALIGLSRGDIAQLADNLIIAFATTVVGLFAGSIGYILTQVRRRWYWQDMADIDYILDVLEGKK